MVLKNKNGECMIEHHICYRETEGWDETVWMTQSEHKLLHIRLRKENKCGISPDRMREMSTKANHRTDNSKEKSKEWKKDNPDKVKEMQRNNYLKNQEERQEGGREYYQGNKEKVRARQREYYQENREKILEQKKKKEY